MTHSFNRFIGLTALGVTIATATPAIATPPPQLRLGIYRLLHLWPERAAKRHV